MIQTCWGVLRKLTCIQSFEGLDPKAKLSETSQVTLSEAEVRTLRRDMQEQENLIQGYQVCIHNKCSHWIVLQSTNFAIAKRQQHDWHCIKLRLNLSKKH